MIHVEEHAKPSLRNAMVMALHYSEMYGCPYCVEPDGKGFRPVRDSRLSIAKCENGKVMEACQFDSQDSKRFFGHCKWVAEENFSKRQTA